LFFRLQYEEEKSKKRVDEIDQKGLDSDPNFQKFVFSSEDYFQDFTSLTKRIHTPVLIIAGEKDHAIGPSHHASFQFPHSNIVLLKGSHHPYVEDPWNYQKAIFHFIHNSNK